jgi:D-alanine-D-alanine ligase
VALPPTEIVKGNEVFDYRSKYLPGLSRKITPIQLPDAEIQRIRNQCVELFNYFGFHVYARIDGFYDKKGNIYLNDPNTTSGMMPSSFFFHQAAEIGLNPSQFLTYIIRTSLYERANSWSQHHSVRQLLSQLDERIKQNRKTATRKKRVAVMMGGYSTERHISVESGRNIYEKLASSAKYEPFPVFVTGSDKSHSLYRIPINVMLKDNADDIRDKVMHFKRAPIINKIIKECAGILQLYGNVHALDKPAKISYAQLAKEADAVFIALHGRPGEDGTVQRELEKYRLPYNGSGYDSSQITINKFDTNELLKKHGFLVAEHKLVHEAEWKKNKNEIIRAVEQIGYPLIAKPADDGCSSAVKKIKNRKELINYADGVFRSTIHLTDALIKKLQLKPKEEFPKKSYFLVEKFIDRAGASHFLEITGGMLTHYKNNKVVYETFEPSEALAEGEILSLEEKFLAGQGQNITPARYDKEKTKQQSISKQVQQVLMQGAKVLGVEGYCRIDAFVRIYPKKVDVIFIEVNSLPGMTPATAIFHQCALNGYKPYEFIDKILEFGTERNRRLK